ncbi:glycosyl-4,4'-diaponeurosporenoate acyltransferase CrtO family protein [Pontibacter mangrovi]|uniref:Glycosyl-4,4'-diaponeurosporenoate acyltransferase n=1 Tax=Pontibacter mangrovi TaxID=2589816 RepID=A0A501WDH3_9BACT|nr:hypothetical protein [Pontibacter mangrovi]TPE43556.1 hypothetical protein FJM65_12425 [Pontibacter mangrovi]
MIAVLFRLLSIIMVSWLFGLLLTSYLKRQNFYHKLSSLKLIGNDSIYKAIGIELFKWSVTKTFYRHLNKNIKFSRRPSLGELVAVRNEMTNSEILHAIAFVLVLIIGIPFTVVQKGHNSVVLLLVHNIIFNLYPTLLQQYNKTNLDKIIDKIDHQLTTAKL